MQAVYRDFLKSELSVVQKYLDAAFEVDGKLMGEVAAYVGGSRGKMMRPALVCLSAKAFGYDGEEPYPQLLGAAIELFHVATLLHDDVIDKAPLRRGRETVNAKWGDDVAILFADYLYATSFDYALEVLKPEVVRVLSQTTQKMTEGEMFQIEKRGDWLSTADYFSIVKSKTAYLFSASTGLGAMIAGASGDAVEDMFHVGMKFGMAFQITDDALDYEAQGSQWGKRVGSDLNEGKQTLPLLYTLQNATPEDRAALVEILNGSRDFDLVHDYVARYNAIERSLETAGEHTRDALETLARYDNLGEAGAIMSRIVEGVLARQA